MVFVSHAQSQIANFSADIFPVSKCVPGSTCTLDIADTGTLALTMPIGISYVMGSVTGATEISSSGNQAIFHITSPGSISYQHSAACTIDETQSFNDEAVLNNGTSFSSTSYNVAEAAPQITLVTNSPATANVGQTVTRTLNLTNGGIGKVEDWYLEDIITSGSVQLVSGSFFIGIHAINASQITITSGGGFDTLRIHLTQNEMQWIGNLDNYFDGNDPTLGAPAQEDFNLSYQLIPLNCGSGYAINSNFTTYYGCGATCSENTFTSVLDLNIPAPPNLSFSANNPMPSCLDGTATTRTLTITNSGGVATDLLVNFGNFYAYSANNGYSSWIDTSTFKYSINGGASMTPSFSNVFVNSTLWEGNAVCANAVGKPSLFKFGIPFIPAGATVVITYDFYKCCSSNQNCPSSIDGSYSIYEEQLYLKDGNYKNACGDVTYNVGQQSFTYSGISHSANLDYPSDIVDGQTKKFKTGIFGNWNNLTLATGAYLEINTTLPNGYVLQGSPVALSDAISWPGTTTQSGNIITTRFNLPVPANFDIAYFEYQFDAQLQCSLRLSGDPTTIYQNHVFVQNPLCACERQLICLQNSPLIHCPGPCAEGIGNIYCNVQRLNFGLPDADNNGIADAGPYDFSKMATNRAFYGDTIEYTYGGVINWISANGPFTNAYAESSIPNFTSRFTVIGADVTTYSNGSVTAGPTSFTPTLSGNIVTTNFSSMVSSLSQGDSIVTRLRIKVTDNALVQAQKEEAYTSLNKMYASRVANPSEASGNRKYCDQWGGNINTVSSYYTVDGYAPSVTGCNQASMTNYQYFSVGVNGTSNYYQKSIRFPYEVRKHAYSEKATFLLPASYNYIIDSAAIIYYRTAGYSNTSYTKHSAAFTISGDSVIVPTAGNYADFGGAGSNPISDDGWLVITHLYVSSTCHTTIPSSNVGMVWNMNSNNVNAVPSDYDYFWNVAQGARKIQSNPVQLVAGGAGIQNVGGRTFSYNNVVISNQSSSSSNYGYAFIQGSSTTQITEFRLNGNLITPNANGYYNLNAFSGGQTKNIIIKGMTSSCVNDTFKLYYNWNCRQFPTTAPNPSQECYPPLTFILKPLLAKIDGNISALSVTPNNTNGTGGLYGSSSIGMCNNFPVELVINSAVQGTIYDILANTKLPAGISYVNGSAKYEHPIGSAAVSVSAAQESLLTSAGAGGILPFDIQVMSNNAIDSLQGTMSASATTRQLKIRFLAKAECSYSGTGKINTTFTAKRACQVAAINNGTVKSGSNLKLVPPSGVFSVAVNTQLASINGCGVSSNGNITVTKSDAIIPTNLDSIRLTLPSGVDINSVTCSACNPALGSATISDDGITKILAWPFPVGNVTGSFTIQFAATANAKAICTTPQDITASVTQQKVLTCQSVNCSSANTVEAGSNTNQFVINLPEFTISPLQVSTYSNSAPFIYNTTATITNTSSVSSDGFKLMYAIDTDDDGVLTSADSFLGSEQINTVLTGGNQLSVNKNFNTSVVTNGHNIVVGILSNATNAMNSSCTCGDAYQAAPVILDLNIPKPTLTAFPNKQFCFGQNIQLKAFGLAGATFNWTTPSGCSGVVDNSISGESTITIENLSSACNGYFYVEQIVNGNTSPHDSILVDGGEEPQINFVTTSCVSNMGQVLVNSTPSSGMQYSLNGGSYQNSNTFTTSPGSTFVVSVKSASSSCVKDYVGSCVYCSSSSACVNPPKDSVVAPNMACATQPIAVNAYFWNASNVTWSSSGTGSFSTTTCNSSPCQINYMPSAADLAKGSVVLTATTNDPDGAGPCVSGIHSRRIRLLNGLVAPTVSSTSPVCENSGLSLTAKGAVGLVTWNGPSAYTAQGDSVVISSAPASYNGIFTATISAIGCDSKSASAPVTVLSAPALVVNAIGNPELCTGAGNGSIDVDVLGGSGSYTICYNGSLSNCVTGSSAHFSWVAAGNYTITVVDQVCPGNVFSYPVTVNSGSTVPAPIIASTITLCEGEPLVLSGSVSFPATTINWTKGPSFNAIGNPLTLQNATASMSGVYYAKALNASGCASAQVAVNVIVGEKPIINHVQVNCISGVAQMEVTATSTSGSLSYSLDGVNFQVSNLFTSVAPGNYSLVVKNISTNCMATLPVSVINCACPNAPEVTINAPLVSCGLTPVPLQGLFTQVSNATWTSTGSGSFTVTSGTTPLNTVYQPSSSDLSTGYVHLMLTTDDPDGAGPCTPGSKQVLLLLRDSLQTPVITQHQMSYCAGDTVMMLATNVNSPVSWSGVGGYAHSGDTAMLINTTQFLSGNYTAAVSGNGCATKSSTHALIIAAPPALTITASSLPEGCEGQGNGSIHVDVNGGSGNYTICYTQFANCLSPVTKADFKYLAPGTYTISVADVTCPNGYSTTTSVVGVGTHVDPPLTATYNSPVCEGDDLVLTATGGNTGHYLWTDTKNNFTDTGMVITRSNAQVGMSSLYKVQHVVDGCASQPLFVDATVFGTPEIVSIDTMCLGIASEDSGRIVVNAIANGGVALEYSLNGASYQLSNTFDHLTNGLYQVAVRPVGSDCETTMRDINLYCACICNKEATVTIFPNPNNGVFSVNANLLEPAADIVITMYDFKGGKIYEQSLSAEAGNLKHDIQLKNYAVGTYMLRIKIDENVFIIPVSCN